jgi:hypothetical protein
MSDIPPKNPLFDKAPGRAPDKPRDSIADPEEEKRVEELKKDLERLRTKSQDRGRAEQFLPYILVRSVLGDRGDRPINVPFWESPDIWTAAGDPSVTPSVPDTPGGTVHAGAPNTVYAHVWNLGRAPIAGVKVEFYWFDPSLTIESNHAHLIGMTRVDLGPRSSPDCHKLVKCPRAWVPVFANGGHECLFVRASSIGDTINPAHAWDSWAERHVAQRNISVLATAQMAALFQTILANTKRGSRVQMVQVGEQARLVMQVMAPKLRLDPLVKTDVLAELQSDGSLMVVAPACQTPGALAPVHTLSGMAQPAMETTAILEVPRINLTPFIGRELKSTAQAVTGGREAATRTRIARNATPVDLLQYERFLPDPLKDKLTHLPAPQEDVGQVLRLTGYIGDQLVSGYTVVLTA